VPAGSNVIIRDRAGAIERHSPLACGVPRGASLSYLLCSDQDECDLHRLIACSPSVPRPVLHNNIVRLEMHLLAVIEFEPDFALQHDAVVHRLGRVSCRGQAPWQRPNPEYVRRIPEIQPPDRCSSSPSPAQRSRSSGASRPVARSIGGGFGNHVRAIGWRAGRCRRGPQQRCRLSGNTFERAAAARAALRYDLGLSCYLAGYDATYTHFAVPSECAIELA
jgi:hypothetical protein